MSSIITLQDFKNYIGTTQINEQRATDIINGINTWVEDFTGRVWGEIIDITDIFDYEPVIFLSHIDISSITSVKVFGTEIENYKVNKQTGRMLISKVAEKNKYRYDDFDGIEVKYKAGKATIPADVKQAVLQLVAEDYNKRDDINSNITSESLGGYSVSYGSSQSSSTTSSTAYHSAVAVLSKYKVVRL